MQESVHTQAKYVDLAGSLPQTMRAIQNNLKAATLTKSAK